MCLLIVLQWMAYLEALEEREITNWKLKEMKINSNIN